MRNINITKWWEKNICSYPHQHNTNAARRRAMTLRMVPATSVGCPFGATGPGAVEPLLFVGGGLAVTGGRGGSITLSSVRMGFGASAGGKSCFDMIEIRLPGWTGDM